MKRYAETISLILANAVTLVIALDQQWPLALLAWPFWAQSIVVGGFAWRRILVTPDYTAVRARIRINGRRLVREEWPRARLAGFFLTHYGFFHLAYLVLLLFITDVGVFSSPWLLAMATVLPFLWSQYEEHRRQVERDRATMPTVGLLMGLPYLRVIPMHLTLFFGLAAMGRNAVGWAVGGFIVIKASCEVLSILLCQSLERAAAEEARLRTERLRGYP